MSYDERYYELRAVPEIVDVVCPKHRRYMRELRNGIFGAKLWYCPDCDRPYYLKPTMMKTTEFDRTELDRQIAKWKEDTTDA